MLSSLFSRILILVGNFALVAVVSRIWGAEGKGEIALFITDAVLAGMFFQLVSGSSVSYCSRKSEDSLVLYHAYGWSLLVGMPLLWLLRGIFFPSDMGGYFVAFVVLESLFLVNQCMLVARRSYGLYHVFSILQVYAPLLVFLGLYFWGGQVGLEVYFLVYIGNLSLMFLAGLFVFGKQIRWYGLVFYWKLWRDMFHYGWRIQESTVINFFRQRFSYYFIGLYLSHSALGVYSVAVAIVESMLAISKSMSTVLYGEVLNSPRDLHRKALVKNTFRVVFCLGILMALMMFIVPSSVYTMVFGKEFLRVKVLVLFLIPGVFLDSLGNVLGYYYAGINQLRYNNIRAFLGFILVGVLCYILVPYWGMMGAALATSISYGVSSLWLLWGAYRERVISWSHCILSQKQWNTIRGYVYRVMSGR